MKNTLEYVVNLAVAAGQRVGQVPFVPMPGKIVGCAIYTNDPVNPGIMNAAIYDNNNNELSRPQHIDNYRNREAEYMKGFKPLFVEADGQGMSYQLTGTQNLVNALETQLILYYELPADCKI